MTKHIAVLMGGWSKERPVSLASGDACAKALEDLGYKVTRVDVAPDIATQLEQIKPDIAFNALHGPFGEDGCIQGILEILKIPYTHSGVLASALAMRKDTAKTVMAAAGIPIAPSVTVDRREAASRHVLSPPYVIKPVCEGSSFGIIIVKDEQDNVRQQLLSPDWAYGDLMMVERFVPGKELTCAVMGDKALDVIEIVPEAGQFYDYESKYAQGGSLHILPANIDPDLYKNIQECTLRAHQILGCRGVSRSDFRYDDTPHGSGEFIIMEVNTQPGMTRTSLVPDLASHIGMSFAEFVEWMIKDASCNR